MGKRKTYIVKSKEDILRISRGQVTVQGILNKRIDAKRYGWADMKLSPEFKKEIVEEVLDILGGYKRDVLKKVLMREPPIQHWGLSRIILSTDRASFVYVGGQDYPQELSFIRRSLYSIY